MTTVFSATRMTRKYRANAERELRKLGGPCLFELATRFMGETGLRPQFAHDTAKMIGDMIGTTTKEYVFWLLRHPDGEVRVIAYENIYRFAGENVGYGDTYWRVDRETKEREKVIIQWWEKVK